MKCGLDRVAQKPELLSRMGRIGIVTNQSVATAQFLAATEIIYEATKLTTRCVESSVTAVFGPQHGYGQTEQYNMVETPDGEYEFEDGKKVPLFSLYSETRIPKPEQLTEVDTLVVDLIDVGCRVYTYMLTLAGCLKAAAKCGKKVVVLDRPNPLGLSCRSVAGDRYEHVEGNLIDLTWHSFVGWYEIPMRHGLSMGELGKLFIAADKLEVNCEIVAVEGLARHTRLSEIAKLPWTLPSPNLPQWESAFLFPAFVSLEGTNVSEGRGTTLPFQIVGAPYLNAQKIRTEIMKVQNQSLTPPAHRELTGVVMRPHNFKPTFNDHTGQVCQGLQFHIISAERLNVFALGIEFLAQVIAHHPEEFRWKEPGYEYNFKDPPILLILGHENWMTVFERIRAQGLTSQTRAELDAALRLADEQAQTFARSSEFAHIYP